MTVPHPQRCDCKEIKEGGNICHSNDGCECQLFGDFDDPIFCGQEELKEPCNSCKFQTQACAYIMDGKKMEDACMSELHWLKWKLRQKDGEQT